MTLLVTDLPIDVCGLISEAIRPENGALATFMGSVRNPSGGRAVQGLFYEAYAPMALKKFNEINSEVRARWQVQELSIIHRVGRLLAGDVAVLIIASSAHRRDALSACSHAIERVKQITPIWKKEFREGPQGVWLENCCESNQNETSNV